MESEAGEDEEEEVEEEAIGTEREIGGSANNGRVKKGTRIKSKLIDLSFSFHLIVIFFVIV